MIYPHRWVVPSDMWRNFFDNAEHEIGVLVYSGLFLSEDAGVQRILRKKAEAGARVRMLLGDPESESVAQRGSDEGIDATMAAKIRNAMVIYAQLPAVAGVEAAEFDPTNGDSGHEPRRGLQIDARGSRIDLHR